MLEVEDYKFFMRDEFPRDYWRIYSTLANLMMRAARAIVIIDDIELKIYVETPYFGHGKRLLGREVINKLILILDGLGKRCCTAQRSPNLKALR